MYWVVNSCVEKSSKLMPNSTVWHIEFVNLKSRERRVTYVERHFKNYANWRDIINSYPLGMIVTNLEALNGKRINADSKPEILFAVEQQELADLLAELWR
jgi:hypothetical protein